MKTKIVFLAAILFSVVGHAGNFVCKGELGIASDTLKVEGRLIGDWLKNMKATATSPDYGTTVGRSAQVDSVDNSRARKYKDYSRYDLKKLTETKNFGQFLPFDMCAICIFDLPS